MGAGADEGAVVVVAGAGGAGAGAAGKFKGPSVPGSLAGTDVPGLGGNEGCIEDPATG